MAKERDRDELDRSESQTDEDVRGLEDDDFEDVDEGDEEDIEDEEQYEANEGLTGEVGGEGGSPGETVVTRRPGEQVRGSEAGETWSPGQDETKTVERTGQQGQPRRRSPSDK